MAQAQSNAGKVITFGEIMGRLSTPANGRFTQATSFNVTYGGGEANVAIALAYMGQPAAHVTRFPDNDLGAAATMLLRKYGVDTSKIIYGGNRLGLYFLETGASVRPSKVVYDRANSSFAEIKPGMINWDEVFKGAVWFHWTGISPAISQGAADVCLEAIEAANRLGLTVSADINYRKNLWQYGKKPIDVLPALIKGCHILFASKGDMEEIVGPSTDAGDKFNSACERITAAFPNIRMIVNTKRGSVSASHNTLSAVLWKNGELLKTKTFDINPIVDRIGGGDAFVAGFVYGYLHLNSLQKVIEFGVAASVLKHSIEGDANLCSVAEIEAVAAGETSGKLSR